MFKNKIKKIIPPNWLSVYHWVLGRLAAYFYLCPSEKLIVIGVTGTKGKSSTVNLIAQYLEKLGFKVGYTSTAGFKVDKDEWLNDQKMTMLGRFKTQKLLHQMVLTGCQYAIIETSSQGIMQFRHRSINYDAVVFTNLTPEHLEAHGGFDNYRAAKEKLFEHLVKSRRKKINGKKVDKIIISNADDQETERLRNFQADKFFTYGFRRPADLTGKNLQMKDNTVEFLINDRPIQSRLFGLVNGYNILAALATIKALDLNFEQALNYQPQPVPGRQEWIDEGQDFKVMVDYAYEPVSLAKLHQDLKTLNFNRIISVLGGTGGGRDQSRQPILGELAAKFSDVVIITNDDPYDDDQQAIADRVAQGALGQGKILDQNLFKILDRRQAVAKAVALAATNDLVLLTGKGAEQFICVADGKKIPHDDRQVARQYLQNKNTN